MLLVGCMSGSDLVLVDVLIKVVSSGDNPVAGVEVYYNGNLVGFTDSTGKLNLALPQIDTFSTLSIKKMGYQAVEKQFNLSDGQSQIELHLPVLRHLIVLCREEVDDSNEQPRFIQSVVIDVNNNQLTLETNEYGIAYTEFSMPTLGDLYLEITHADYEAQQASIKILPHKKQYRLDFQLHKKEIVSTSTPISTPTPQPTKAVPISPTVSTDEYKQPSPPPPKTPLIIPTIQPWEDLPEPTSKDEAPTPIEEDSTFLVIPTVRPWVDLPEPITDDEAPTPIEEDSTSLFLPTARPWQAFPKQTPEGEVSTPTDGSIWTKEYLERELGKAEIYEQSYVFDGDKEYLQQAIKVYERILKAYDTEGHSIPTAEYSLASYRLARFYLENNNAHKAMEILTRSLARDSRHAICHFNLGLAYRDMDQPEQAANSFSTTIKLLTMSPGQIPNVNQREQIRLDSFYLKALMVEKSYHNTGSPEMLENAISSYSDFLNKFTTDKPCEYYDQIVTTTHELEMDRKGQFTYCQLVEDAKRRREALISE